MTYIQELLFASQDLKYRDFYTRIVPNVSCEKIIGVRTPDMKKIVKQLVNEAKTDPSKLEMLNDFINDLPHRYYEENNFHGSIIVQLYKNIDEVLNKIDVFLPYVDNWATCDALPPKIFKKYPDKTYEKLMEWLDNDYIYAKRFAIVCLLKFYMDDEFRAEELEKIASVKSDEYYLNMAVAWCFAEALAKQFDCTISYIENRKLDKWTHNKAIQKAIESYRVSDEHKIYLRGLKIK